MSRASWANAARADLAEAIRFIAADSPAAARTVLGRVHAAADKLADMPTGRVGRLAQTYEKVVARTPYVLTYQVAPGSRIVTILRLIHMAPDRPGNATD